MTRPPRRMPACVCLHMWEVHNIGSNGVRTSCTHTGPRGICVCRVYRDPTLIDRVAENPRDEAAVAELRALLPRLMEQDS